MADLALDPWQQFVLTESLGERKDGTWAAFEVGLEVARQNGKGAILSGRQLTGAFLLEEELQIHSAHEFDTCLEAFARLVQMIESSPDLDREVLKISESHGREGIVLRPGRSGNRRRIRFRARTKGGGRGFSGDTLYLDEAMYIKQATHGSLFPILSTRPNPQIWYVGSAVNQEEHLDGEVFAKIRQRGLWSKDPRLAWFGWGHCPEAEDGEEMTPDKAKDLLDDPEEWARANPALGIRIDREYIEAERRSLSSRNFAVERVGIGDWPKTDGSATELFDREEWEAIEDRKSLITGEPVLAVDVSVDRSSSSISVAGRRSDGNAHVEVIDRKRGTGWVAARLGVLAKKHNISVVVLDGRSQAASLQKDIEEELGFEVVVTSTAEYAQACAAFFDAVPQKTMRHGGQDELDAAVRGAATRPLGEAWAWSRKKSDSDITPLVSCTLARWGMVSQVSEGSVYEERGIVVL